jgi:hypothetical protein
MDDMGVTEARTWEFELPKITVRELLRSRVAREVEFYNTNRPEIFQGLVQPEESERILNGYRLPRVRPLDPEQQFERAIRAFRRTHLCCWQADDRSKRWTKRSTSRPRTGVEFLKLVPLAGG